MVASRKYGIFYEPVFGSTLLSKQLPVTTFAGEVPDNFQQQAHGFAAIFNGINSMVCKSPRILLSRDILLPLP